MDMLGYPNVRMTDLGAVWPELGTVRDDVRAQLEIEAQYAGYLDRQDADIRAYRRDEALALPQDLNYADVPSLSAEARARLAQSRPATLGAAARLEGVTPAALIVLLRYVKGAGRTSS